MNALINGTTNQCFCLPLPLSYLKSINKTFFFKQRKKPVAVVASWDRELLYTPLYLEF